MPNEVKLEITITKEAVETFFSMLSSLFPLRESREESTKEENKEITPNSNTTTTTTTSLRDNNKTIISDVDDVDVNNNHSIEDEILPPTLEDINNYITTKGYKMDGKRFFMYYKGLGWKTKGGTPIICCWKEYIDSWMNNGIRNQVNIKDPKTVEERRKAHPFEPSF